MTVNRTSQSGAESGNTNLQGIAWMLLTGVLFVGVTGVVRHLGTDMSPLQAAFIRYAFGVVLVAPVLLRRGAGARPFSGRLLRSRRLGLHAVRGVVHGMGVMLWFYAMARIPIAQVTALGFTAPIFTTLGAALFLGERLSAWRLGAVLASFGGAMIILRPGFETINSGALAQLAAAPCFAISFLITKKLTATESSATIVAYMAIFVTIALLPAALLDWRTPTWENLGWLFVTAVLATLGHLSLTQALRSADITVTQPFAFLQLVWATLLGYYVFSERPDIGIWIGGAVIVATSTFTARRESLTRRP